MSKRERRDRLALTMDELTAPIRTERPERQEAIRIPVPITVKAFSQAKLTTFRTHALKLYSTFIRHARGEKLRLHPTLLRPAWPNLLLDNAHAARC